MVSKKILIFLVALFLIATGISTAAALEPIEKLGKSIFFDNISDPDWMACAECHAPRAGWTGPIAGINLHGAVYRGAVPQRFGNRKPPSAAYATTAPLFDYAGGFFFGGNFWDGRATGWDLGNPAADQARGPFLNPVEQNNPSKFAVVSQVCSSRYANLFVSQFQYYYPGIDPCVLANVDKAYDFIAIAIAAYEGSSEVNAFTSKYDAYLAGKAMLTTQEMAGLNLFNGKAMCTISASQCLVASLLSSPITLMTTLGFQRTQKTPFTGWTPSSSMAIQSTRMDMAGSTTASVTF